MYRLPVLSLLSLMYYNLHSCALAVNNKLTLQILTVMYLGEMLVRKNIRLISDEHHTSINQ
jgi:hypothetical protein